MAKHRTTRDPAALTPLLGLKHRPPGAVLGIAFDLGTNCGYACTWFVPGTPWVDDMYPIMAGQLDLSARDYDSGAIRFVRLRAALTVFDPAIVFFEDVVFVGAKASYHGAVTLTAILARAARPIELFGAFKATVGTWCEERAVPCRGFTIQAIKKRATGKGNVNKEAVIAAANEEFGAGLEIEDYEKLGTDNVADALFCLALGLEQYSMGVADGGEGGDDKADGRGR
jgi:hypothetical protein